MRPVSTIDAEIAAHEAALRRLHAEKREAIKARAAPILAAFDAGANIADISEEYGLSYATVQGILFRAGRTLKGRTAIRRQLASIGTGASA